MHYSQEQWYSYTCRRQLKFTIIEKRLLTTFHASICCDTQSHLQDFILYIAQGIYNSGVRAWTCTTCFQLKVKTCYNQPVFSPRFCDGGGAFYDFHTVTKELHVCRNFTAQAGISNMHILLIRSVVYLEDN